MPKRITRKLTPAIPIWFVTKSTWPDIRHELSAPGKAYADASGFEPTAGRLLLVPDAGGALAAVLFGLESEDAKFIDPLFAGKLATLLPPGDYRFANDPHGGAAGCLSAALGFALSTYRFQRYKKNTTPQARLATPDGVDEKRIARIVAGLTLARDLVNTPANDMGPAALEKAALALARAHRATASVIRGEALLKKNFPLIHAVGKAASEAPRLVDISWGRPGASKVTLVGKGVCFDTGGLDIKPSSAMGLMKKDMAGAATAMALAHMIMDAKLPVRLRVLLPIVENAISGPAFRPGDIYPSRKGLTVEIGNTDAEGRLILADALALADADTPELLFDFATLTGAARVAMGPEITPFYTMDDQLAGELTATGMALNDPVWRLPLWEPYDQWLDGKISTLNNIASGPFAGSIVAALFLRRFVEKTSGWAHFDIYGWNATTRPGRPEGGDAQTARLLYDFLERRYARR